MDAETDTESELLAFFEVAPVFADSQVPWIYNTARYLVANGEFEVRFEFSPSYREVKLAVAVFGHRTYELLATDIHRVIVHTEDQNESLEIRLSESSSVWLTLKPSVSVFHQFCGSAVGGVAS